MNAGQITAIITGATSLVGAVTALIAVIRHVNGPAHQQANKEVK